MSGNVDTLSSGAGAGLPALVLEIDAGERIVYAGPTLLDWYGLSPEQVCGQTLAGFFGDTAHARLRSRFEAALAGAPIAYEHEIVVRGEKRSIQVNLAPHLSGAGRGFLMIKTDVSPFKAAEALAVEAGARFESAFHSAAAGIGLTSPDGRFLRVNRAYCGIVGYSEAELLAMTFQELTHPEDLDADVGSNHAMFQGDSDGFEMDKRYLHKDGRIVHIHLTVAPVRDGGGRAMYSVAQVTDVTERVTAERALREREILFRAMNEASPFGVFVDTPGGECVYVNPAYLRITGLAQEEALGSGWRRALHPGDREHVEREYAKRGRGSDLPNLEHRYLHGDGRVVLVRVKPAEMRDGTRLLGVVGVVEDITEARRNELEVARLNRDLEAQVAERTRALEASIRDLESFSYSVAHDLRTPLRAIDGFSALLMEKASIDDEARHFLDVVRGTSQRMARLIDDLLTLAHAGRKQVRRERLDLAPMARAIMEEVRRTHPAVEVEFVSPPACEADADPALVRAVLQNLLDNACKFSGRKPHARIEFGVAAHEGETVYFVRDNGEGFDPEFENRLFQPFQRLHGPDEFPGNGIGLASALRIVQGHGGRMWARGIPREGATFYFTLEAARGAAAP
jgi:PAS domain S-box-containing protein